jgi:hypothetical protein
MKCNSISKSSLLVLSLLLTVAGAHAQTAARAKVPFAFKVGAKQMPAGTYTIRNDAGSSLVTVRNVQTGTSVLTLGRPGSPSKKTNKLLFHRYGSQYFLTAILGSEGSQGMQFPATKQEKELQVAYARAHSGNNIEIASR